MTETFRPSHYDDGVPQTLKPYPPVTMPGLVRQIARECPDDPAMHFLGNALTYGELERQSDAFAAALLAAGVRKGDRVAVLLPNSPQMIIAEFGIWKAGAIAVLLNPFFTEHELERSLDGCDAGIAVVLDSFYEKISHLRSKTALKSLVVTAVHDYLPKAACPSDAEKNGGALTLQDGDRDFCGLIERHGDAALVPIACLPQDPALFLFSGGTTGTPKCANGCHEALIMTGMQVQAWFRPVLGDDRVPFMLSLPLYHVYPQVAVMSCAFIRRSPVVLIPDPRNIELLIDTIRHLEVGVLPGVPTLFNALAAHPLLREQPEALRSIRLAISAAASLHLDTKQRFEELTGATIIEAYGLTEGLVSPVCTPVNGRWKPGSVGLPLPDIEVRIVDADEGYEELPAGEAGEIVIRSPQLMTGYWREPEETEAILRDGWLYTGDLGYLDSEGYLYIIDRKKDVIKPSGFQVWPREVEEVIAMHPAVLETGVAGVPDDYQGEAVKAWVVLRSGAELDAEALQAHCREKLTAYKIPKHIEFCDLLPKSAVGKVLRRVLVERHNGG